MRLLSWNLHQSSKAWHRLVELAAEHDAQVALVQEACSPPAGLRIANSVPDRSDAKAWHTWDRRDSVGRRFCAAVVSFPSSQVEVEGERRVPLVEANWDDPTVSHPGQFAVAEVVRPGSPTLTVVSLYGIWEYGQHGQLAAEPTLHRAISDLTPLLETKQCVIFAGDLNVYFDYGMAWDAWADKYDTIRGRLAAYGMTLVGPHRTTGKPLPGCPCDRDQGCRHVQTLNDRTARPKQLDWVFASRTLPHVQATVLSFDPASDHAPILIDVGDL